MNDSITQIERVKRVCRLKSHWSTLGHPDDLVSVVRCVAKGMTVDAADRMVSFVATTEDLDVDDEVVIAGGVDPKSYFFTNKSVFIDHQYDIANFIGNARRVLPRPDAKSPTAWVVQVRLHKAHQYTPTIMELAADGLIGSSIGFARQEGGRPTADEVKRYSKGGREPAMIARRWEWIEQSITAMPANVSAQAIGFEDAKAIMLDELTTKGRVPRPLAVALGLPDSPKRRMFPTVGRVRAVRTLDI